MNNYICTEIQIPRIPIDQSLYQSDSHVTTTTYGVFSLLLQSLEGELSRHQLCPNLVSPKLYSQGLWFPTNLVVWLLLLRTYSEDAVHPGVTFIAVLFMDNNQHEDYFT